MEIKIHVLKGDTNRNVWLNGKPLDPKKSQKIKNHSPDGFNWGYPGSGPAQLALAVMLELYSLKIAEAGYQKFKWKYIATLPQGEAFSILFSDADIKKMLEE